QSSSVTFLGQVLRSEERSNSSGYDEKGPEYPITFDTGWLRCNIYLARSALGRAPVVRTRLVPPARYAWRDGMPKIEWRSILAILTAGLIVSTRSPIEAPSIGDAVATTAAHIVDNVSDGPHLGFDTFAYPGDDAMRAWLTADKPYRWVGYYLSAPCHTDSSWEG